MKSKTYVVEQQPPPPLPESKPERSKSTTTEEDFRLTSCGIGSWRPKWMQRFAEPIYFLINMSIVGVVQSMTGPLFISSMSTLEKRYSFDSKISGIILIADNFSQLLISPFIGYLAIRYNRSRLIGMAEIILAISCFMTAMPYYFYGHAAHLLEDPNLKSALSGFSPNQTQHQMCQPNAGPEICVGNSGSTVWPAVFMLFVGSFFRGIGFTCYFVVGFPYLDDNVSKKNSPMYLSVMQAIRLIGPAFGFLMSSFSLRYYENPMVDPGISRKDPRFVGAWWISFCVVGFILLFAAIPMLFFPQQFRNASVKASTSKKRIKESGGSIQAFKRFITNPVIMLYLFGSIFRYIGIGGYIMFKTKYIESQYRQSSSSASLITGTTSIMPMAIGILAGGFMLSIFKPSVRKVLVYVFLVESVSLFTFTIGTKLGCDPIQMAGQFTDQGKFSLDTSCNQGCSCSTRIYGPLCGPDKTTTYFSACHAGCQSFDSANKTFSDCGCFDQPATAGFCSVDQDNCQNMFNYLLVILGGAIISSTARTANSLLSFRSVDPMDKSFTMGAASSLMAIFAFIPYPIIFGHIADSVCLIWEKKCGRTGNCWLYDQVKFRNYLHGASIFFMAIGSIFDFIIIFFSGRIKNFYEDEEEEEETGAASNGDVKENKIEMLERNPGSPEGLGKT